MTLRQRHHWYILAEAAQPTNQDRKTNEANQMIDNPLSL
jgi:hypothetical protein